MAKAFSAHEREVIKSSMLVITGKLIRQKNIRQITVEEITRHVDIAKGSFYSFYPSREELLWEVIKQEEKELAEKIRQVSMKDLERKEKIRKIFSDLFLGEQCLVFYLSTEDISYLIRKLPPELIEHDRQVGHKLIESLLEMCGLARDSHDVELLMSMLHTLQFVASKDELTNETKTRLLAIMVETFAGYLDQQGD